MHFGAFPLNQDPFKKDTEEAGVTSVTQERKRLDCLFIGTSQKGKAISNCTITRFNRRAHKTFREPFKKTSGFPGSSVGKESTCNAGDSGLIPESGRSD